MPWVMCQAMGKFLIIITTTIRPVAFFSYPNDGLMRTSNKIYERHRLYQ